MSKIIAALLVLFFLVIAIGGSYAFWGTESNEYADAFCPELKNEAVYKKRGLEPYRTLIPGKNGWVFRTDNDFRQNWELNKRTLNYLSRLDKALKAHNADLVIVMPPLRGLVHSDQVFGEDQKKYGLDKKDTLWKGYTGMLEDIRNAGVAVVGINANEAGSNFYYKRNHHWTSEGARIMAQKVAERIKGLESYQSMPERRYETVEKQTVEYDSSFEKGFEEICGTEIPPEETMEYETRPVQAAQGGDALFGDGEAEPRIVLLGTSNSVLGSSYANFEGSLKEFLSRDILNKSYIAAGIDTGLVSYLSSEHYRSDKPKILIWEVPSYYDLNVMDDKLFNQAIPAAYGPCADNPLMQRTVSGITPKEAVTLFNRGYTDQDAEEDGPQRFGDLADNTKGKYLHLQFADPVEEDLKIEFVYDDGGTKIQNFKRSSRYPHDGSFYTLFPKQDDDRILKQVLLSVSDDFPANNNTTVSVCSFDAR